MKKPIQETVFDVEELFRKKKLIQMMAKINGYDFMVSYNKVMGLRTPSNYRRRGTTSTRQFVERLYQMVKIKDIFPKVTKEILLKSLNGYIHKNRELQYKKPDRVQLLKERRCRRLMPLDEKKYLKIAEISKKHYWLVDAIKELRNYGHVSGYIQHINKKDDLGISEKTIETLQNLCDRRKDYPTEKEIKYA